MSTRLCIDEAYIYDEVRPKTNIVDGESHSRLYTIYKRIINRAAYSTLKYAASDEKHKVYEKWSENYFEFKSWALYTGYNDNLMLGKIDKSKGYNPDNCYWIIKKKVYSLSDEKLIASVEKAFKIKLYDWQIKSLKGLTADWPEGRGNGRTFIHCVKLCLKVCNEITDKKTIDLRNDQELFSFADKTGINYARWFKSYLSDIYDALKENKIPVRNIIF